MWCSQSTPSSFGNFNLSYLIVRRGLYSWAVYKVDDKYVKEHMYDTFKMYETMCDVVIQL